MKTLFTSLFFLIVIGLSAQNTGRVIIHNSVNQEFVASLNGVRLSNEPVYSITYDFLDQQRYNLNLYFANSPVPLQFTLNNRQGYETVYVLMLDQFNNYQLMQQSQTLLSQCQPSNPNYPNYPNNPNTNYPNYPNPVGNTPVSMINDRDYRQMVDVLKRESMDATRLDMAKTFLKDVSISSSQVAGIVRVFSFETAKVDFAKFAYAYTTDKQNYYKVYDSFTFSSSKNEISEFIKKQ